MSDGSMSQEEIDALLRGVDSVSPSSKIKKERNGLFHISQELSRLVMLGNAGNWLFEDGDDRDAGGLSSLAACYALHDEIRGELVKGDKSPFPKNVIEYLLPSKEWEKHFIPIPKNRIRELSRAGALLVIEIDRLLKEEAEKEKKGEKKEEWETAVMTDRQIILSVLDMMKDLIKHVKTLDDKIADNGGERYEQAGY